MLAIVGNAGGANVGDSLRRAALAEGGGAIFFDALEASEGPRAVRALMWRLGRRPPRLSQFSSVVCRSCEREQPAVLLTTGAAPVEARDLAKISDAGVITVNFSTDDPWNRRSRADWFLRALVRYDVVFTPRRANVADLERLGCRDVRYLPFAYDPALVRPSSPLATGPDVLFVGGADPERATFIHQLRRSGVRVALVGDYWDRFPETRPLALGHKPPEEVAALTMAAKVNLCLVRRANRDGHVMRSFEIGALGGCALVEDTDEHRDIFGPDGENVRYFSTASDAGRIAASLLADEAERSRLKSSLLRHIRGGPHTYSDRLATMLSVAQEARA